MGNFGLTTRLLQCTDVDAWVKDYNCQRVHSGKHCFGKIPWQTLLESKDLAHAKQLDRTE